MRLEFYQPAGEHERYARHAFDNVLGRTVPWNLRETEDGPVTGTPGTATVIAVKVDDDGRGATWTVDFEGDVVPTGNNGRMSFGIPEIPERWWE